jgi:hypothetical protein
MSAYKKRSEGTNGATALTVCVHLRSSAVPFSSFVRAP